jgi:hypothetical protein
MGWMGTDIETAKQLKQTKIHNTELEPKILARTTKEIASITSGSEAFQ